jgi:hypothetical protein
MLDWLALDVGGPIQLERLDDDPLPDKPFWWEGIPDDVTARVHEVLVLIDRCCEEMLDFEYRTACRRVLARVASQGPEVFRRKGRAETAAAALVWTVGKANDLFEQRTGGMQVTDLMNHFGLGKSSVRPRYCGRADFMTTPAICDSALPTIWWRPAADGSSRCATGTGSWRKSWPEAVSS